MLLLCEHTCRSLSRQDLAARCCSDCSWCSVCFSWFSNLTTTCQRQLTIITHSLTYLCGKMHCLLAKMCHNSRVVTGHAHCWRGSRKLIWLTENLLWSTPHKPYHILASKQCMLPYHTFITPAMRTFLFPFLQCFYSNILHCRFSPPQK